jgi:hypothetical protein
MVRKLTNPEADTKVMKTHVGKERGRSPRCARRIYAMASGARGLAVKCSQAIAFEPRQHRLTRPQEAIHAALSDTRVRW